MTRRIAHRFTGALPPNPAADAPGGTPLAAAASHLA
jgi:hypothetical protein